MRSRGSVYQKNGGWFYRFSHGGRDIRRLGGPTREVAEQALAAERLKIARNAALGVREVESVSFSSFRSRFSTLLAAKSPRWAEVSMGHFDTMAEFVGSTVLRDITPAVVEDLLLRLRDERRLRTSTVNRYRSTLSSVMKAAVDRGFASSNPVESVKAGREDLKAVPWMGAGELRRLVAVVPEEWRSLVIVAGETGLRRSELARLEWRDFSSERRTLVVRQSKSGKPREVPLTSWAMEALASVSRDATPLRGPALVWPGLDLERVSRLFPGWVVAAGLPRMSMHGLRHSFASRLMQRGVPSGTIMALGGWASLKLVQRYASHAPQDAGRAAVALLEEPERKARTA